MDLETAKLAFQVLQFLLTGGVAIYVYMSNKDKVTNDRITKMESDIDATLDKHGERIARMEEAADHAPTHDDLGRIHEKVNRTMELMGGLAGEMKALTSSVHLIHEHLLKGAK